MKRATKIVCTLGPASQSEETIVAMIRAGMDVARLNTSHASLEEQARAIERIRSAARIAGKDIAILLDLAGPKLRTGPTEGGRPLNLVDGQRVRLTNRLVHGTEELFTIQYPYLLEDVRPGTRILLDDGLIELEVESRDQDSLVARVLHGGLLGPNKGVHIPGAELTAAALTEQDRRALELGSDLGVDLVALSFVRRPEDVREVREVLARAHRDVPIVAKIERRQALDRLDEIVAESDGVMVARGDLGVEVGPAEVPIWQRRIIAAAARQKVPVITATQMLESMVDSPRPTRAEASDVANAVWDRSDALMLSGETAVGRFPVQAVAMMDRIIRTAESVLDEIPVTLPKVREDDHSFVVALAARDIVESDQNMRAIACFTKSGYTAFLMSKVYPRVPVVAITPSPAVARRLHLARSVIPVLGDWVEHIEEMFGLVDRLLTEKGFVDPGEEVVVVASVPVRASGVTNFLKLHQVGATGVE